MHTRIGIRWLVVFGLALTLGAFFIGVVPALAQDNPPTATVATGRLNVRTGPGVGYTVVTRLEAGESVALLARNNAATWVRIRLSSAGEGWVNARYLRATVAIADLPVSGVTTPAPAPAAGAVTAAQLELRSGPGLQNSVLAVLGQGQALTLLGRTADGVWVKVRAGSLGEGWVLAQVSVRVPGDENGAPVATIQASVPISSLPVPGSGPAASATPRVTLSSASARPLTPVFVNVTGFPAYRDIAAVLTSPGVPAGFVVAAGTTDAAGAAQLFFRMPDMWPSGAAITEAGLSLAVGATDGSVLVWNGLTYRP